MIDVFHQSKDCKFKVSYLNRYFLRNIYNFADNLMKFRHNLDLYYALIVRKFQVSKYKTEAVTRIQRQQVQADHRIYDTQIYFFLNKFIKNVDTTLKFFTHQSVDRTRILRKIRDCMSEIVDLIIK